MTNSITDSTVPRADSCESSMPGTVTRRRRADRARQVADVVRRQIDRGDFPGGQLPDEQALAADFTVSRNTVREALNLLRGEGLINRIPGFGTVASNTKYPHPLDELRGLAETLDRYGEITNEVRTIGPVRPPRSVAERLRVPPNSPVIYLERLRHLDGLPLSVDLTYLVADIGERLLGRDLHRQDVFRLIEEVSGRSLGLSEITLEAVNADTHTATMLGLARGSALLVAERLTRLADGTPVDLEFIRFRGDRMTMSTQLRRPHGVLGGRR